MTTVAVSETVTPMSGLVSPPVYTCYRLWSVRCSDRKLTFSEMQFKPASDRRHIQMLYCTSLFKYKHISSASKKYLKVKVLSLQNGPFRIITNEL